MRTATFFILACASTLSILSCAKDSQADKSDLYGQWKTSYGDTITFARENGLDILTYDMSLNNSMPAATKKEFSYQSNKLGLKDGFNGNDFHFLQTFTWNQRGRSFTIQGIEWFMFLNSTTTYFTFTKIR